MLSRVPLKRLISIGFGMRGRRRCFNGTGRFGFRNGSTCSTSIRSAKVYSESRISKVFKPRDAVATTVRTISEASWRALTPHLIEFRITGNGFLKQMVRNIVGTLLYLERKNLGESELRTILAALTAKRPKPRRRPWTLSSRRAISHLA